MKTSENSSIPAFVKYLTKGVTDGTLAEHGITHIERTLKVRHNPVPCEMTHRVRRRYTVIINGQKTSFVTESKEPDDAHHRSEIEYTEIQLPSVLKPLYETFLKDHVSEVPAMA